MTAARQHETQCLIPVNSPPSTHHLMIAMTTDARKILVTSALPYAKCPAASRSYAGTGANRHLGSFPALSGAISASMFAPMMPMETAIMLSAEAAGVSPEDHIEAVKADHLKRLLRLSYQF